MKGLDSYYDSLLMAYEREQDEGQRYEEAAERAAVKLQDELARIRKLNPTDRGAAMYDLVSDLANFDTDGSVFDGLLEKLAEDTDPERTAVVMRWAGEEVR